MASPQKREPARGGTPLSSAKVDLKTAHDLQVRHPFGVPARVRLEPVGPGVRGEAVSRVLQEHSGSPSIDLVRRSPRGTTNCAPGWVFPLPSPRGWPRRGRVVSDGRSVMTAGSGPRSACFRVPLALPVRSASSRSGRWAGREASASTYCLVASAKRCHGRGLAAGLGRGKTRGDRGSSVRSDGARFLKNCSLLSPHPFCGPAARFFLSTLFWIPTLTKGSRAKNQAHQGTET